MGPRRAPPPGPSRLQLALRLTAPLAMALAAPRRMRAQFAMSLRSCSCDSAPRHQRARLWPPVQWLAVPSRRRCALGGTASTACVLRPQPRHDTLMRLAHGGERRLCCCLRRSLPSLRQWRVQQQARPACHAAGAQQVHTAGSMSAPAARCMKPRAHSSQRTVCNAHTCHAAV